VISMNTDNGTSLFNFGCQF